MPIESIPGGRGWGVTPLPLSFINPITPQLCSFPNHSFIPSSALHYPSASFPSQPYYCTSQLHSLLNLTTSHAASLPLLLSPRDLYLKRPREDYSSKITRRRLRVIFAWAFGDDGIAHNRGSRIEATRKQQYASSHVISRYIRAYATLLAERV